MDSDNKSKSELWDYYQELVKAHGFNGITDLLANNARLQSIIDEANAQIPLGTIDSADAWQLHIGRNTKALPAKLGGYVYAHSIPAQQSPAVAVPDNGLGRLWCDTQKENELAECGDVDRLSSAVIQLYGDISVLKENLGMAVAPSPRITEQDALPGGYREEWKRNVMLMWSCVRKHDSSIPSDVLDYMREQLLTKLNEANHETN